MGRSVDYLSNAAGVAYINYGCDEDDAFGEDWTFFKEGLIESLQNICPSLDEVKAHITCGETVVIAENNHCQIGVSFYCGLVSVSIRIHTDDGTNESLAANWIKQMWPKIEAMIVKNYEAVKKLGTFSNGEGVFEKIKKQK